MYANCFLGDNAWPSFQEKANKLGLEKLAVAVTHMCQLYLGLPDNITWCKDADEELCRDLLNYIFECGNFGFKQGMSNSAAMVISHGRGLRGFFRNLQRRGEANWQLYKKHAWLRPCAWLYQLCRYSKIALFRRNALRSLSRELEAGKKRGDLIDRLGGTSLARKK